MDAKPMNKTQSENTTNTTGERLELVGVPVPQTNGRVHYSTAISARTAHDLFTRGALKVDIWSHPSNTDGYQRTPTESRLRRFSRYVQSDDGASPVSVLLFSRWPERVEVKPLVDGADKISVDLDSDHPLYIPDGQHRLLGLKEAFEVDRDRLGDYNLPAVLMIAANSDQTQARYEEATQFYVINNNQKRVATDLAQRYRLRVQERMAGTIAMTAVLPSDETLQGLEPFGVAAIDALNDRNGPWHALIDLPNNPGSDRPVSQNSFLTSIRPLIRFCAGYGWTVGKVVDTIEAFWKAVGTVCPEAMNHWHGDGHTDSDHTTYVLRTTSGVFSLNELLHWLVNWHKIQADPTNVGLYEAVLRKDPEHFCDEFWSSENEEGAASYGTSQASFRDLRLDIQREVQQHLTEL